MKPSPLNYNVIKQGASKPLIGRQSMSVQKPIQVQKTCQFNQKLPANLVKQSVGNTLPHQSNGLNTIQQTFSLSLKDAVDPSDPTDTSVWTYNIPTLAANQKSLILDFVGGQYLMLATAASDFPQQLFLYCDQISGYSDKNGNPTNRIAVFRLSQLYSLIDSGVTVYTGIFTMKDPLSWQLGTQRQLTFRVGDRTGIYSLPIINAVNTQFRIMHVSY